MYKHEAEKKGAKQTHFLPILCFPVWVSLCMTLTSEVAPLIQFKDAQTHRMKVIFGSSNAFQLEHWLSFFIFAIS